MERDYPLKDRRLEQLYEAGFNVADFKCWAPGKLRPEELKTFLAKHGRISCRHFHENEKRYFKCPVLYDQTDFDKVLAFCLEHNKSFYTLCNEAISTKESVCAGNILVHDEHTYFVEYFYGPGTPRDIESKGPDELRTYSKSLGQPSQGERPPEEIMRIILDARKFQPLNKAYIIEFSLYPYPIGRRQTKVICWEWRWGWLHYQLQANRFLMDRLKAAEEELSAEKQENERLRDLLKHATEETALRDLRAW